MMMQYLSIKSKYPDTLIFFRLGDFYELFFEDAKIASRELSLVLTGKSAGQPERVPMCGIPYHASKTYIKKLIEKGYKVGIVEQVEEASQGKSLVQRDLTQIYTPGSFVDDSEKQHNFLVALGEDMIRYILVYGDLTTGDVYLDYLEKNHETLFTYLQKIACHEVVASSLLADTLTEPLKALGIILSIDDHNHPLGSETQLQPHEATTYYRWLHYVEVTQKKTLTFLKPIVRMDGLSTVKIDGVTLANLEVIQSLKHHQVQGSLLWLLDEAMTPMGSRLIKQWLTLPSAHLPTIRLRQGMVRYFVDNFFALESIRTLLKDVYDIPRIVGKLHTTHINPRDLISLKKSLSQLPHIVTLLRQIDAPLAQEMVERISLFPERIDLLERAIMDEPPISIKEGHVIQPDYDPTLRHWVDLAKGGKQALLELEQQQRITTGIKNLKVGYNQIFGYYLEVSNGQLSSIKPEFGYERRQTLANAERFITKELKALESDLLQAEVQQRKLEESIFLEIVKDLQRDTNALQFLADQLATLDALAAFALVSSQYQFVEPILVEEPIFDIEQSRHPVIEKVLKKSSFVPNDFVMDAKTSTLLITGPNMGGKSTFMRQIAMLVILAQIGCFVPAKKATMMVVDAIYSRIGASDDLVGGQSTFMMEMSQTQFALAHATARSLLIFDEIGRGTATYDGMALAQSIIEYVTQVIQSKMLFSTHYHELTQLESSLAQLKNMHVAVHEENEQVTFLYQLRHGSMSRSFGIHVAQLAQLPTSLIQRAKTILTSLEQEPKSLSQSPTITPHPLEMMLQKINPLTLSPLEALAVLVELKKKSG